MNSTVGTLGSEAGLCPRTSTKNQGIRLVLATNVFLSLTYDIHFVVLEYPEKKLFV